MLEREISSARAGGIVEEVVRANSHGLDHHLTSRRAVGDQHLLRAAHQLAVHQLIGHFKAEALQATGIAEHLKGTGVALLKHHWVSLVGVGGRADRNVSRCVVDAGELERNGRDLAHCAVQGEGAAAAGGLVQHAIVVEVDRHRTGRCIAVRRIGDAGAS